MPEELGSHGEGEPICVWHEVMKMVDNVKNSFTLIVVTGEFGLAPGDRENKRRFDRQNVCSN